MQDGVWQAIKEKVSKYDAMTLSDAIRTDIDALLNRVQRIPFDGGEWYIDGNEVDLFVAPERRGKWATKRRIMQVLNPILDEYGVVVAHVHEDNTACMRLALGVGFRKVDCDGPIVRLEMRKWEA